MAVQNDRRRSHRGLTLGLVVLVIGALALACQTAAPAPAATSKPAPAPKAAPKPAAKAAPKPAAPKAPAPKAVPKAAPKPAPKAAAELDDSLVFAWAAMPANLDPHTLSSIQHFNAHRMIHEALVILDNGGNINPMLAESWENINPTTWQFKLRSGIKYSNGDDLKAEDVVASVKRLVSSKDAIHGRLKSRLFTIADAEKVDDLTVNIITSQPDALALKRISMILISNPILYGDEKLLTEPIGTGPYRVTDFRDREFMTAEAVGDHWSAGDPAIQKVKYAQISEPAVLVAAVKAGDIDIAIDVPGDLIEDLRASGLKILNRTIHSTWLYDLDKTSDTPLKDVRVRYALNYAVDKKTIIDTIFAGAGELSEGQFASPGAAGYNPELTPFEYDVDKAKDLLAEAGTGEFTLSVGIVPLGQTMTEAVQGYFKDVGVKLDIELMDQPVFFTAHTTNNPQRQPVWWWRVDWYQFLDADTSMRNFHGDTYPGRFVSEEYEDVLDAASVELDPDKRETLLQNAAAILREEAPVIFMHEHGQFWAYNSKIEGFEPRYDNSTNVDEIRKLK